MRKTVDMYDMFETLHQINLFKHTLASSTCRIDEEHELFCTDALEALEEHLVTLERDKTWEN